MLLKLVNVSKIYRPDSLEVKALQSANMSVKKGDFVAIMGSSGSGKSTLMHIAGCLDLPTEGKVILEGFIWEGEHENGNIKEGVLTWPNGKKYVGQFERSQPHGKGIFTCPNGSSLEGEWRNSTLVVTGFVGHDLNTKIIERFDGTKADGGWLHLTDGTKIWIFTNLAGQWEVGD